MKVAVVVALTLVLCCGSAYAGGAGGGGSGRARPTTNFLIVLIDDVGMEWFNTFNPDGSDGGGPLNGAPAITPQVTSLAAAGVKFTSFQVTQACAPTRVLIQTGRGWTRTGQMSNVGQNFADAHEYSIPAMLDASWPGWYRSAFIGERGLGPGSDWETPLRMGYDYFFGVVGPYITDYADWDSFEADITPTTSRADVDMNLIGNVTGRSDYPEEVFVAAASAWFTSINAFTTEQPWIMSFNMVLPHTPEHVVATQVACTDGNRHQCFHDMLTKMDTELGALWALLPAAEKADTLLIFMSDNGTAAVNTTPPGGGGPLIALTDYTYKGGKGSKYVDGVNSATVVAGGVVVTTGRTVTTLHTGADVLPTIMDYSFCQVLPKLPKVDDDWRYNGQTVKLDGHSMRTDISGDCPGAGYDCDIAHSVVFSPSISGSIDLIDEYVGRTSDDWKRIRTALGANEEVYLIADHVFAEGIETDHCSSGDCSGLTGTALTKYNEIGTAYQALLADSP